MSNDSEAEDEVAEETEETEQTVLQEGDFVEIDYTARTVEDGRLVESGRHEALRARGGVYEALWTVQTGATPVEA